MKHLFLPLNAPALLVCLSLSDALRFATLPSVLLISTLFRLGLSVSATRPRSPSSMRARTMAGTASQRS